ncbi:unannotated protein [freshwater metagenome]|uniref:Unannotated protein n=1 Tax=freshwater metagenome TaxID=449393 RepID=A0A6J7IK36_9ZZZZ
MRHSGRVPSASIALCPPIPGSAATYDTEGIAAVLLADARLAAVRVLSPAMPDPESSDDERTRRAHWVAYLAVGLATSGAVAPVLLVTGGASGALSPALGFSQKAARRAVSGYVLIDAAVPPAESRGGDWPDAPVHYLASPAAEPLEVNLARLRGWTVHDLESIDPRVLGDVILRIAII